MSESDQKLEDLKIHSVYYTPLSAMTSRIFFSMQKMGSIYHLYQYPLQQFEKIIKDVLNHESVTSLEKQNYDERKEAIQKQLFTAFNHNISNSILERHEILFAMRLA
jgi:hypothetical protein